MMDSHSLPRREPLKAAGLPNILNNDVQPPSTNGVPSQLRDSGFYSTGDVSVSSKHTSAASFTTTGLSPGSSAYLDKTPSPVAGNMAPQQPTVSPSGGHMSVASMVSPTVAGGSDRRQLTHQTSMESNHTGTTLGENLGSLAGSIRRESVDGRISQPFSDMRLGTSPYTTNNQSTASIQNTLHQQRNRPGLETPSIHRISNGYAPNADRNPDQNSVSRTAPTITGPATSHIARAAEPTKGQAWAFPEEDIQRVGHQSMYDNSRRSSITESIASSQFTADSRLPTGQRRLEDGPSPPGEYHHPLQHRQLSDLQVQEGGPTGTQPYSRTPELRVSHKLAERKRRTEMKELFDALRDEMPQERGSKASKWEILTKAINEHRAQRETIRMLQGQLHSAMNENDMLRRELQGHRVDNSLYRVDGPMRAQQQNQQAPPPAPPPSEAAQGSYPHEQHYASNSRTELPPLRSISSSIPPPPESMTGVQYETPGANGYRQDRY